MLLIATIIVAGTRSTSNAPREEETILPMFQLKNSMFRTPAEPAKLTMTSETEDIKNLLTSLGATLMNPTIIPKTTIIPSIMGLSSLRKDAPKIPATSAKTTPIVKACAPSRFSFDLIILIKYLIITSLPYISFYKGGRVKNNGCLR